MPLTLNSPSASTKAVAVTLEPLVSRITSVISSSLNALAVPWTLILLFASKEEVSIVIGSAACKPTKTKGSVGSTIKSFTLAMMVKGPGESMLVSIPIITNSSVLTAAKTVVVFPN